MIPAGVIRTKRDGGTLSRDEIGAFVRGFLEGSVADYQMTAFLMAVFFSGMSPDETAGLTRVMVESGDVLEYPGIAGTKVDKHSTGGVGDCISLPLAPLVAACGVPVPMISGRGLGHTGGTLDKLESIGGFRTDLSAEEMTRFLKEAGYAMGGQTASLAPADRRMYSLRDVTATVESIPLIVSSILSKKAAAGVDALVLDVKCGRGAFMKTESDALALARELTRVGDRLGLKVVAFLTDMDQPLGTAIGNAVEVESSIRCLKGSGPPDLMTLVRTLGAAMICLGGVEVTWEEAEARIDGAVADGSGLDRFRTLVRLQEGDPAMVDDPGLLPRAPVQVPVVASDKGYLEDWDPLALGMAVVSLGGGRRRAEDQIDPGVGILLERRTGDPVQPGDTLATVLAADEKTGHEIAEKVVEPAATVGGEPPEDRPLIRYLVTPDGEEPWRGAETWSRGQ